MCNIDVFIDVLRVVNYMVDDNLCINVSSIDTITECQYNNKHSFVSIRNQSKRIELNHTKDEVKVLILHAQITMQHTLSAVDAQYR